MSEGLRVGVIGATGALGGEVLSVLAESSLPVAELVPVATDRSLGQDVEWQGEDVAVLSAPPRLAALDLLFLCAPRDVSLEYARQALHAAVPCVDAAGALSGSDEVEPRVALLRAVESPASQPVLVAPPGAALSLALVLDPLARAAGLRRVVATVLEAASSAGRGGIESLYEESVALFNQADAPEPGAFGRPVAFDCVPGAGAAAAGEASPHEAAVEAALERLLGGAARVAVTQVQVPVFVGLGASLSLETERPLAPAEAEEVLAKAPGVELRRETPESATLRSAAGGEVAVVGRVRRDPSGDNGLLLWLAADVLRLAAVNAVQLAVARVGRPH